ncbi:MAG: hypothetical protein ABJO09_05645 [Hyphomicrobiales bacterium]
MTSIQAKGAHNHAGKAAIVTGTGRDIGRATALSRAACGQPWRSTTIAREKVLTVRFKKLLPQVRQPLPCEAT